MLNKVIEARLCYLFSKDLDFIFSFDVQTRNIGYKLRQIAQGIFRMPLLIILTSRPC